jgi:hypothetical protein
VLRGLFIGVLILSSLIPKSAAIQLTQQFRNIASEKYADNLAAKFNRDKKIYNKSFCFGNKTQQYQKKNDCQTHEMCLLDKSDCRCDIACRIRANRFISNAYKSEFFFHFTDLSPPDIN